LSYPELYSDESVVLQAQNVKVKSVSFEVVLTTRRLVLIDTKKNSLPPQEINLATLKDVESGENAIRDPTITISIITISGNTRQMVLTFSKTSGGERKRECDDWVRALRQNITSTVYHPVGQASPPREAEIAPAAQPPVSAPRWAEIPSTPQQKKRIEIARPVNKIVEPAPVMPVPIETSSLPSGSFCNRCGNRVPPESAFCNRCGTPVVNETDSSTVLSEVVAGSFEQPAPPDQQPVQVSPPPMATDRRDRPIEEVIHSIEPLIEDSVPRTAPSPLIPAKQVYYPAETAEPASQIPAAADVTTADTSAQPGEVKWPVLSHSATPDIPATPPGAPVAPPSPGPLPPSPPRKISFRLIAVLALVVLAVIAGAFVFMQGQAETTKITPTPEITVPATTASPTTVATVVTTRTPTPAPQQVTTPSTSALLTPTSGVWVKIMYSNKYSGTVGTPEWSKNVADSGDQFYQISTSNGPVVVSIQKSDGSSAELAVDVYKDGTLMKHAVTTSPKGIVEYQVSFAAANTTATVSP